MNPREQGDWGELSAFSWLVTHGAHVYVPWGHSPDVDFVADLGEGFVGIQVKSTRAWRNGRWDCTVCTRGGNQSWNGVVKRFSAARCDYLFACAADGRRWFIPASAVDAGNLLRLGGPKYERFEVEPGSPLAEYGKGCSLT